MSDARPEISFEDLDEMEGIAKQIHAMPGGANKEKAIQAFKNAHAKVLEHMDMPTDAIAPDAHLLGILDWGDGALRAGVGESALLTKHVADKVRGKPSGWRGAEAIDRLTDALLPMGDPARGSAEYMERYGVDDLGQLSDTWVGKKLGVERGGRWDLTGRGALGFGLDMGLTTGNIKGLKNKWDAAGMAERAAENAPKTASTLAKELAALRKEQALAPPKTLYPTWKSTTEGGKTSLRFSPGTAIPGAWDTLQKGLTDPLQHLGELLYKSRFSNADKAAEATGKKLPSKIMMENGMPGVTSGGIREGMRGIINRTENSIDQMATPEEGLFVPKMNESQFLLPVKNVRDSRAAQLPGSSIPIAAAQEDVLGQFEHAARQDPGVVRRMEEARAQSGLVPTGPNGELLYENGAVQEVLPGVNKVTNNSGFSPQEVTRSYPRIRRELVEPAVPARRVTRARPDGSPYYEDIPAKPAVYKDVPVMEDVPMMEQVHVDRPPTVEPGRDIHRTEGTLAPHGPAPETALQTYDRPFSWTDARQIRRNFQKQAADAGLYSQRDRLLPGPQAKVDATAKLHNATANRAGELELRMLDQAKPGLGGAQWEKHRDVSGLLEGGQYLDREFTGGGPTRATTGTKKAFSPSDGRLWDMLDAAKGVAQAGGGKVLMNPWTRKALAPAAKATWINDYWNREYNESDQNPYGLIKKYGVQK